MGYFSRILESLRVRKILKVGKLTSDNLAFTYILGLERILNNFEIENSTLPKVLERVFLMYSLSAEKVYEYQLSSNFIIYLNCWIDYYKNKVIEQSKISDDTLIKIYTYRVEKEFNFYKVFLNSNSENIEYYSNKLNLYWNYYPLETYSNEEIELKILNKTMNNYFSLNETQIKLRLLIRHVFPIVEKGLIGLLINSKKFTNSANL